MPFRPAKEEDIPRILEIYSPYVLQTTSSFEYTVPSPEDFACRFHRITAQFPWIVWEEAGVVMGYAYGSLPFERAAYQWCSEVSIYMHPDAQGRGIGKKLYAILETLMALQGYKRTYAIITDENKASIAFHQAVGYTQVAAFPGCGFKFGAWGGTIWMEKELNSWDFPSNPPFPVSSIVKSDRIFQEILDSLSLS